MKSWLASLLVASIAVGAAGCGGEPSTAEEGAVLQAPIINGTLPASHGALAGWGVVSLDDCTGTLLTNRHVLTAHHCTGRWSSTKKDWSGTLKAPGQMDVTLETPGGDLLAHNEAILEPPGSISTWSLNANDFALITLDSALAVLGTDDDFYNPIYEQADGTLENQSVFCLGYGGTVEAVTAPATFATGFGTLTTANMTISSVFGGIYDRARANGVVGFGGDSGSTCFFGGYVTGVQSTCGATWRDINGNGIDDGWPERNDTTSCRSSAPSSFRGHIQSALLANVTVRYDSSPALPAGAQAIATVTTTSGEFSVNALAGQTVALSAPRSGRVSVQVTAEPANTMCPRVVAKAPMSGSLEVSARCLGDGLVSVLL